VTDPSGAALREESDGAEPLFDLPAQPIVFDLLGEFYQMLRLLQHCRSFGWTIACHILDRRGGFQHFTGGLNVMIVTDHRSTCAIKEPTTRIAAFITIRPDDKPFFNPY
jgi:hypothetical protein